MIVIKIIKPPLNKAVWIKEGNIYKRTANVSVTVADTGELQWFQLKPPLKSVCAPNLFTIRVSDKITNSYA